jgi:two-component system chemotaxis sensor kinase CheA
MSRDEIRETLESWKLDSIELRFHRIAAHIESLAERLGKAPIEVRIDSSGIRIPAEGFAPFWQSFTHLIRNAVDHGLETPEERRATGKPEVATVVLSATLTDNTFSIAIEDAGRGINWDEVKQAARRRGLPHETRAEQMEALFADGVSTRQEVTETSGRGVGLSALREACRSVGGHVEVWTELGMGTRFRFVWPRAVLQAGGHGPAEQELASGYVWLGKGKELNAGTS